MLQEAVVFQLTVNRPTRQREAQNYSAEPTFAAERKIIVDKPASIQTDKNHGGDINSNARENRRRFPKIIHALHEHACQTNQFRVKRLFIVDGVEQVNGDDFALVKAEDDIGHAAYDCKGGTFAELTGFHAVFNGG